MLDVSNILAHKAFVRSQENRSRDEVQREASSGASRKQHDSMMNCNENGDDGGKTRVGTVK